MAATIKQLKKLSEPFPPEDLEYRVGQSGVSGAGKPWAKLLTYVTSRGIMARLDNTVGPDNWQNRNQVGPNGELICKLGINVDGVGWLWRSDGAGRRDMSSKADSNSVSDDIKGGLSDAFKRAGVLFGMGRELYELGDVWAECTKIFDKKGDAYAYAKGNPGTSVALTKDKRAFCWGPPGSVVGKYPGQNPEPRPAPTPISTPEPAAKADPAEKPDWGAMTEMGFDAHEVTPGTMEAIADIGAAATDDDVRARFRTARHSGALSEVDKWENLRLEFAARDRIHSLYTAQKGAA